MALLSLDMIREIRGVADAYTARERARLGSPVRNHDLRQVEAKKPDPEASDRR